MRSLARPFVPLIVGYCFPKGEGLRDLWLLSTTMTAIATRLGALSRSHGRRTHQGVSWPVRC